MKGNKPINEKLKFKLRVGQKVYKVTRFRGKDKYEIKELTIIARHKHIFHCTYDAQEQYGSIYDRHISDYIFTNKKDAEKKLKEMNLIRYKRKIMMNYEDVINKEFGLNHYFIRRSKEDEI